MRWILPLACAAAGASCAYIAWTHLSETRTSSSFVSHSASMGRDAAVPASGVLFAGGVVESSTREVNLHFEIDGKIKHVFVQDGTLVKAGDILAELETDVAELKLAEARTLLHIAQTERAKLQAGSGM